MRLFISYSHQNTDTIRRLVGLLQSGGHTIFWDTALQIGRDWRNQLREEIEQADGLVFALTPASVASEWCQFELTHAIRSGKVIIPILLEDVTLPATLQAYQYADLRHFTVDAVAKLLGDLVRFTPLPNSAAPSTAPEPVGPSERALAHFGQVHTSSVAVADRGGTALAVGKGNILKAEQGGRISVGLGAAGITAVMLVVAVIVAIFVLGDENATDTVNLAATREEEGRLNQTATAQRWTETPTITPTATHTPTPTATPQEAMPAASGDVALAVAEATAVDFWPTIQAHADIRVGYSISSIAEAQSIAELYNASYVVWAVPEDTSRTRFGLLLAPKANAFQDQQDYLRFAEKLPPSLTLILPNDADPAVIEGLVAGYLALSAQYNLQALAHFSDAVAALPASAATEAQAAVFFSRGLAHFYTTSYAAAIDDFSRTIDTTSDPTLQTIARLNRALMAYLVEDYAAAAADLDAVERDSPPSARAAIYRGLIAGAAEDWSSAIASYTRAIQLDPTTAYAFVRRALAYYWRGDFVLARDDATAAIALDATYAYAYFVRARATYGEWDARGIDFEDMSDRQSAEYDRIIDDVDADDARHDALITQYATAYTARGDANMAASDPLSAEQDYARALGYLDDLHPDYPAIVSKHAIALVALSDYDTGMTEMMATYGSRITEQDVFGALATHYRDTAPIAQPTANTGTLAVADYDIWRFEGVAGQTVSATIDSTNETLRAFVVLPDNRRVELPSEPYRFQSDGETLLFFVQEAHEYWQDPPPTTDYTLTLYLSSEAPPSQDTTLRYGETTGVMLYGDREVAYTFEGQAGDIVDVTITGDIGALASVALDDTATFGSIVRGQFAEQSSMTDQRLTYQYLLHADDTYYISIRQADASATMSVKLAIARVQPQPLALEGGTASVTVPWRAGPVVWLQVAGKAGQTLTISTNNNADSVLAIYTMGSDGTLDYEFADPIRVVLSQHPLLIKVILIGQPRAPSDTLTVTVMQQ